MENKKEYMAPQLTVATFKVEKGYASSINQLMFWLAINNNNHEQLEAYNPHDDWTQGSETFWN